ncbi:hypothetical protein ACJJIQ_10650 [Microbulbifer sp. ANSA003]|uniref:hypothetical protein n=1 Tax=Microbulbifer sp. ANSA003 TaxID=3243360 RepID=UPI004043287E
MGKKSRRFVAKAYPGGVWRVWNKKLKKYWGQEYKRRPDELIDELNGEKRCDVLTKLSKHLQVERNKS